MQSRSTNNKKGIDISHWNADRGKIDFKKVKDSGIDFVYIKLTDKNNFVDPKADENYKGAKEAGLAVGFYHFGRFTSNSTAIQEAKFFKAHLDNYEYDLPPVLDLEVNTGQLKPAFLSQAVLAFRSVIGDDMVLYSGAYFAKTNFTSILKDIPLWVAHYGVDTPMDNGVWDKWFMFQYTSQGKVDGIVGNVDLDEMDVSVYPIQFSEKKSTTKPKSEPTHVEYETYKIKKGDTFWGIAQAKHLSVADIQRVNPHVDPRKLRIGQVINLPTVKPVNPKTPKTYDIYKIKWGDTLSEIAVKYHTTVATLKKLNGLKGDTIYAGKTLKVPHIGTKTPAPKGDQKTLSIVDYLKSIGMDSSFSNRKRLAHKYGIKNYSGTAEQNLLLLKKIRGH